MLKKGNKIISIVSDIMFVVLMITIIASAVLFANNNSMEKSIFGYRFYNVLTPSMEPTIPVGSMVFVKMVEPYELKVGDVITYSTSTDGSVVVTHRINEINAENGKISFITKGDANKVTDISPVVSSSVIGKVNLIVPYLGNILTYIQERIWLVVGGIISLMLILELISYLLGRKKTKEE